VSHLRADLRQRAEEVLALYPRPRSAMLPLLHLVQEKKLAWGTYKQALAALRYFYRWIVKGPEVVEDIRCPRPERRLPVVLSFDEVQRFFAAVTLFKHRMILMTAYAAGLRIAEVVHLLVTDIDSQRMVIRVSQGKRKKDRYTNGTVMCPCALALAWRASPHFMSGPWRTANACIS